MPVVWWPVAVNFQFIFSSSADVRTTNKQTAERRSRSAATVARHLLAAAPAAVNAETLQHINSQCFSSDSPLGYSLHYSLINVSVRLQLSHVKKKMFSQGSAENHRTFTVELWTQGTLGFHRLSPVHKTSPFYIHIYSTCVFIWFFFCIHQ